MSPHTQRNTQHKYLSVFIGMAFAIYPFTSADMYGLGGEMNMGGTGRTARVPDQEGGWKGAGSGVWVLAVCMVLAFFFTVTPGEGQNRKKAAL